MNLEFLKSFSNMKEQESIEKFLIYNSALIISKVKPSATITLKKGENNLYEKWFKYGKQFLDKLNIDHIVLRETKTALIVLIYDKNCLEKCIFEKNNKSFLESLGYSKLGDIDIYLQNLKNRYKDYKCPHELGIFLGFPINDVKDFIIKNKKCLLCGYWMVYNDLENAKDIFSKYDKIKANTMEHLVNEKSLFSVVKNVQALA